MGGPTIRFLRYILRERHLTSRRFTRAATVNAEKAVTAALLRTRVVSHVRYLRLLRFCSRRSPAAFTRRARSAMRARQDLWSNADYRYVYIQLVAWHSGRTSVSGRRTFPVLRLTCS